MRVNRNVLLFLTDKESDVVLNAFHELKTAVGNTIDSYILFHSKEPGSPYFINKDEVFIFTNESLMELKYIPIRPALIPGSNHFPVLQFYLQNPDHDYYWVIEDDVRFNGRWKDFFNSFQAFDHDFISCHLRRYDQEPEWAWWDTLIHSDKLVPRRNFIRSFNPIYRLSADALKFLHNALKSYCVGHHEVLMPTLLHLEGYKIMDFGGRGEFVPAGNENRFYLSNASGQEGYITEGTMRFRPVWNEMGDEKNKLYHPVKRITL